MAYKEFFHIFLLSFNPLVKIEAVYATQHPFLLFFFFWILIPLKHEASSAWYPLLNGFSFYSGTARAFSRTQQRISPYPFTSSHQQVLLACKIFLDVYFFFLDFYLYTRTCLCLCVCYYNSVDILFRCIQIRCFQQFSSGFYFSSSIEDFSWKILRKCRRPMDWLCFILLLYTKIQFYSIHRKW